MSTLDDIISVCDVDGLIINDAFKGQAGSTKIRDSVVGDARAELAQLRKRNLDLASDVGALSAKVISERERADNAEYALKSEHGQLMVAQKKIAQLESQVKFEKFWHDEYKELYRFVGGKPLKDLEDNYARAEEQLKTARYIMVAIDNSGADSQLCDISVRSPRDIHGMWICDAVTQWINSDTHSLLRCTPEASPTPSVTPTE